MRSERTRGKQHVIGNVEKLPTAKQIEQGALVNFIAESAATNARAQDEEASQFDETVAERILWREQGKDLASSDAARSKARSRSGRLGHKHTQRFTVSSARVTDSMSTATSFARTTTRQRRTE
jgi:hypothetical protein